MSKFTYQPLLDYVRKNDINLEKMRINLEMSPRTLAKIKKDGVMRIDTISEIADYLKLEIGDIVRIKK